MKLIATIEGEPITLDQDGSVYWKSKAAIDGDGSGVAHGDPCFQSDTSLHYNGKALDADVDRYVVVPPAVIRGVKPVVLGCMAQVMYKGLCVTAVVGDIGPATKLGEISIALAKALGIPSSPTTGGEEKHIVFYRINPGVAANVDGKQYQLQPSA